MKEEFGKRPTIMVADDDEDLLELVHLRLTSRGYRVKLVYNGNGLIERAMAEHPDLILLDVTMEGVTGTDLCRILKENADTLEIPIILFSANDHLKELALECGAEGYISKPFKLDNILEKIQERIAPRG